MTYDDIYAITREVKNPLGSGLMTDHGQQARASENFAGPVDFETPRQDLPVHFLNFQKHWLTEAKLIGP